MPPVMTGTWLTYGSSVIVAIVASRSMSTNSAATWSSKTDAMSGSLAIGLGTYRVWYPLDMSRERGIESRGAPTRGRIRTPGHRRGGRRGARGPRGSSCARRRADVDQRDEAARCRAGGARRPRGSRRTARDRVLLGRDARDRRDGHVRPAAGLVRGRRRTADPGGGGGDDRGRPGAKPRDDRRQRVCERPDEPLPAA